MSRLLDFKQYLGGADNVITYETFPGDQKTFLYDFEDNTEDYTFQLDQQVIVVDTLSYDRTTGDPNFTDSTVVGVFANSAISSAGNIEYASNVDGQVNITIPSNLYDGPIEPDARANVPIQVVSITWNNGETPARISTHRHARIMRYEPGVTVGNPRLSNVFIPTGVGAVSTYSYSSGADATRADVAGNVYTVNGTVTGPSATTGGQGSAATWQASVQTDGSVEFDILTRGVDFVIGDTINILDSSLGETGAADIVLTVTAIG